MKSTKHRLKIRREDGSAPIFALLLITLLYPVILYITIGFKYQAYTAKKIKHVMNQAVIDAALQTEICYDHDEGEYDEENPPEIKIAISKEEARSVFLNSINNGMVQLGYNCSDYACDVLIDDHGLTLYDSTRYPYKQSLSGTVLDDYREKDMNYNPKIKVEGPYIVAILRVNNKGFFNNDKVDTYKISSSQVVIPRKFAEDYEIIFSGTGNENE